MVVFDAQLKESMVRKITLLFNCLSANWKANPTYLKLSPSICLSILHRYPAFGSSNCRFISVGMFLSLKLLLYLNHTVKETINIISNTAFCST